MTSITALREHLSNVIYIENNFGLDLIKSKVEVEMGDWDDFEEAITMRQSPALVANQSFDNEANINNNAVSISNFFGAVQRQIPDINILPYYYDESVFWDKIDSFKKKLSHFPLIIIDWQLEERESGKTGIDVFDTIIKNNEVLHYYVMYSNEISNAVTSFSEKYTDVKMGEIREDGVVMIDNAIVMFANKRTKNINDIIEALEKFTIENYGFLPQLFLSVKQQIEEKTASLYDDFMGLDSALLPQLVVDEAYDYSGMEEEVISSIVMNKLSSDLSMNRKGITYGKSVLLNLLNAEYSEENFELAKKIFKRALPITFAVFCERIRKIKELAIVNDFGFDSLKNASQFLLTGSTEERFDSSTSEIRKNEIRKSNINKFIFLLVACNDGCFYQKYAKLLSLIKFTEYDEDNRLQMGSLGVDASVVSLCQGDVFISEDNSSYLMCITPTCQLIRPGKINNTYTFLKGTFSDAPSTSSQKQKYSMYLTNSDKTEVRLVNWEFFEPVVLKFPILEGYNEYTRFYRLNVEYTHKVVELYSEYIKQIGVEELFSKRIPEKEYNIDYFVQKQGKTDDSN